MQSEDVRKTVTYKFTKGATTFGKITFSIMITALSIIIVESECFLR
jgi:hypothetical protein